MMPGEIVEAGALVLCRVAGCVMVAAGYASARIPVPVRLFVAVAIAASLTPMLLAEASRSIGLAGAAGLTRLAVAETAIGVGLGLASRILLLALDFAIALAASSIGLAPVPVHGIEGNEAASTMSEIVSLTALAVVLASGLHLLVIEALVESYTALPIGAALDPARSLRRLVEILGVAFHSAMQIAAPFVLFGFTSNLVLGLAGRMLPQIPMQIIAAPFLIAGGLALLAVLLPVATARIAAAMAALMGR